MTNNDDDDNRQRQRQHIDLIYGSKEKKEGEKWGKKLWNLARRSPEFFFFFKFVCAGDSCQLLHLHYRYRFGRFGRFVHHYHRHHFLLLLYQKMW